MEDVLSDAGIEVVTDNEEAQRVLDRANGNTLSEVNNKFNEELEQLTTENADNVQLNVGRPSNILLACGIPNRAIVLYGNKLVKKAKQHGYNFADIKDLPKYVASPIAVFKGSYENSFAILTEMPINGKNALVSIDISKGEVQDVNLVTSVFDKNSKGLINWINNGKLIYAEKNKVLDYLSTSVPITDATNKQELNSVAKILQNFENPIIKGGKVNESREEFFTNPDFYTREYQLEESERQYKKATEVVEALKKAGMPDFHISRSMTNHGVSTYIIGYGAKFRISDHSVTSIHRIKDEEFFKYDTPASEIVATAQKYKDEADGTAEKRREERRRIAKEKWERIKNRFDGYVFKRIENISSNFEKFTEKGNRFLVRQTPHYAHSWDYEWIEKRRYDEKGKELQQVAYNEVKMPSVAYILELEEDKLDNIDENIKFLKTSGGEVYGFTVGGKIYLDKSIATAETPIHEYTHLWADAMRKANPKEWKNIISLLKTNKALWDKVRRLYPELKTDDEIADEVLAHYSGKRGAERLREEADKIKADNKANILDKALMQNAINNVKKALERFWKGVADWFGIHFTSAEEVADKVLSDMLNGVNPNYVVGERNGNQVLRTDSKDGLTKETKNLIALHNINEENLQQALNLGGFPMPSIAITKTDVGHTAYGDISLIFDKESINPKNKKNKVYSGDAWTPTFPNIEHKLNDTKTNDIYRRASKAIDLNLPLYNYIDFYSGNLESLMRNGGSERLVEYFKNSYSAKQFYLFEKGNPVTQYEKKRNEKNVNDYKATQRKIDERIDEKAFENWLKELFEGIVEKSGIRNTKEYLTPSGNRRKWESLFDAVTIDNVVKSMLQQSAKGGDSLFGRNIFGVSTENYKSIKDIRKAAEERIKSTDNEEIKKQKEAIYDRLSNINLPLSAKIDLYTEAAFRDSILEAVENSHTSQGIYDYLKQYFSDITMNTAREIENIVKDIQKISTKYFEAKPQRAVGFDEIRLAVVPESTSKEIINALKSRGVEVRTYENGNQEQRKEIINKETQDRALRFHKSTNTQEEQNIIEQAKANGTYMKAPNGKQSNLNERQWVQVRTKAFKKWFGDWELVAIKNFLLNEKPVSELKGNEFEKDGIKLTDKVPAYYKEKFGGKVERQDFGEVLLDKESVKDSISHGIGRVKSSAFAAVPDIIKNGIIIDSATDWKSRGYNSVTISAPITIAGERYIGIAVVKRLNNNTNRFYLHEVVLQKNLLNDNIKTDTKADYHQGDVAKVLQNIVSASENSSKVVDENGEPLVVYHGSNSSNITVFNIDNTKRNGLKGGAYFTANKKFANAYKGYFRGKVYEVFLNIKNPVIVDNHGNSWTDIDSRDVSKTLGLKYEEYKNIEKGVRKREVGKRNVFYDFIDNFYDFKDKKIPYYAVDHLQKITNKLGYDGLWVLDTKDTSKHLGKAFKNFNADQIVVFNPNQIKSATENTGEFSAENDDIRFSKDIRAKEDEARKTNAYQDVKAEAERLSKKLPISIVESVEDLPQEETTALKAINEGRTILGWYNIRTGEVYIYLPNITSVKDLEKTILHELVSHKGLRELLGKERYDKLCDDIWELMTESERNKYIDYVKGDATKQSDRRAAADEFIAHISEQDVKPSTFVLAMIKIKQLLEKVLGIRFKTTSLKELAGLLSESKKRFEQRAEYRTGEQNKNEGENETRFREWYGGNSGYVGYSESVRSARAKEEGRFPKTQFKKEYSVTDNVLKSLVGAEIISNNEWHHTSKYGNKTTFYGWNEEHFAEVYANNKSEIDKICREQKEDWQDKVREVFENGSELFNKRDDEIEKSNNKYFEKRLPIQQQITQINKQLEPISDIEVLRELENKGVITKISKGWRYEHNGNTLTFRDINEKGLEGFNPRNAEGERIPFREIGTPLLNTIRETKNRMIAEQTLNKAKLEQQLKDLKEQIKNITQEQYKKVKEIEEKYSEKNKPEYKTETEEQKEARKTVEAVENRVKGEEKVNEVVRTKAYNTIIDRILRRSGIKTHTLKTAEFYEKMQEFDGNADEVFQTTEGEIYGFTINGEIYLNESLAGARTRIHSY